MGYWKRHQKKDLEAVLQAFHEAGWRIIDPPKYYSVRCPCGLHYRWIHLTPSGPKYGQDALRWLGRQSCNRKEDRP